MIRPPSVEYSVPCKNILFIKTLTRSENEELIANRFMDWHNMSIQCLLRYNKFSEFLALMEKGEDYRSYMDR